MKPVYHNQLPAKKGYLPNVLEEDPYLLNLTGSHININVVDENPLLIQI